MKSVFIAGALILTTGNIFAKTSEVSTSRREVKNTDRSNSKTLNLSLGLISDTLESDDGSSLDSSGISLRAGRIFSLGGGVSTITSIVGSFSTVDEDALESTVAENYEADLYDIGISQRLSYDVELNGVTLKPFIGASYSAGVLSLETTLSESNGDNGNLEANINYRKLGGEIGIQAAFANGLTPFLSYSVSSLSFSNNADITGNINGQNIDINSTDVNMEDLESRAVTLGLGYSF